MLNDNETKLRWTALKIKILFNITDMLAIYIKKSDCNISVFHFTCSFYLLRGNLFMNLKCKICLWLVRTSIAGEVNPTFSTGTAVLQ
jgi:hypothetical protein